MSLYMKYGQKDFCRKVVVNFYDNYVLKDPLVSHFFKNTDMDKQKVMQTSFVSFALGGPVKYSGKSMKKAHENMQINETHFNKIVEYLGKSLVDNGMSNEDIQKVVELLSPLKDDIVNC